MNIHDIMRLTPVIPVVTIADLELAVPVAQALVSGGVIVIEVALRTPVGLAALARMREACPTAVIGVGTLTDARDFAAADRAGAQFAVTPALTDKLAAFARGTKCPLLPGVMTPTDVMSAREAGFNVLKLFPAHQAGGVGMVKAMAAVFPDVLFCPTGGITHATAPEYLRQPNVACVAGSWLVPDAMVAARDWVGIKSLASQTLSLRNALTRRSTRHASA